MVKRPNLVSQAVKPAVPAQQLAVQRDLQTHTSRPASIQRQLVRPALRAAELHTQEVQRLALQRQNLQREATQLGPISPEAITQAVQRQQARAPQVPMKPESVGDWVTVMRFQAEQAQGRRMGAKEAAQYTALQRQVANTIAQSFRQDRQPASQRHQQYARHLATLHGGAGSAVVATAALNLLPASERPAVQRALDETLQREAEQRQQDEQTLQLHSLQRQLAELEYEATQSVFERIQQRRGAGNPLPEAIQRHLEQGLNHDLSAVRIHDDAEADKLSKSVNATAFTTGSDIYFQSGKFNPNTQSGMELLAHEVTHTVQQSKGQVGKGVDPDAGLESEARQMGRQLAQMRPASKTPAPRHRPALTPIHAARLAGAMQRRQDKPTQASAVQPELGVIKHSDGAVLHTAPKPNAPKVTPQPLSPGKKVTVISRTADGWSQVVTPSGQKGYVQTLRVTTDLPDLGAQLVKITGGTTAIGLAEKYYKSLVKPGQDLRYYVNVLKHINQERGTNAFQGDQVRAGAMLWIPGPAYAASLVDVVGSGSITGGMMAKAKAVMGNGPGANILRSVMESPQYVKEVLGETWKMVKEHWPSIVATTVALVGAELLVGVLAAAPEPTTITKFLAVGLQGIITVVAGASAVAATGAALIAGRQWLTTAWAAGGNAGKIHAASKAFLRMIGNVIAAVASAAGVKASAGKYTSLKNMAVADQASLKTLSNPSNRLTPAANQPTPAVPPTVGSPMLAGVNGRYQAPRSVQQDYVQSPYWTSLHEYSLAADKQAIQVLRNSQLLKKQGFDLSKLSDEELIAIRQYTTRAYVPLNGVLRSGGHPAKMQALEPLTLRIVGRTPSSVQETDLFAKTLVSGMNKLKPFVGPVFRGEGNDRLAFFLAMKPGETWTEAAPFSTSISATEAFDKPIMFTIRSKTGVDIGPLSTIPKEQEILMKPGSKFKLISIDYDYKNNKHLIVAEEVVK
ncbi:eCIS core domain-containing protein [Deinococcus xinjiangensis]|uniref:eCIS core domain-containing protein n=1 Tax=Deinococcus xinjiangensis TaxID=457454 RepID=UPI003365762F